MKSFSEHLILPLDVNPAEIFCFSGDFFTQTCEQRAKRKQILQLIEHFRYADRRINVDAPTIERGILGKVLCGSVSEAATVSGGNWLVTVVPKDCHKPIPLAGKQVAS